MHRMDLMPTFSPDDSGEGSPPPAAGTPTPETSGVTQADIDKAAAAARRDGEKSAASKLLADLGVEKMDDLKAMITAFKSQQEAALSETDRLKKQIADEQAARQAAESKVAAVEVARLHDRRDSAVRSALQGAKYPDLIVGWLRDNGKLESTITEAGDIDKKAIDNAVTECKKAMPDLFRSDAPGNPSHAGAQPSGVNSELQQKAAEAIRRMARL